MNAPTYALRPMSSQGETYLEVVRQLADWVVLSGDVLRPVIEAYAEFVELDGREPRRPSSEYLLEALLLGVVWRARGADVLDCGLVQRGVVTDLVRERRDVTGSQHTATISELKPSHGRTKRGRIDPTLQEITQLFDWMVRTADYDGECQRLEGWKAFLSTTSAGTNREILRLIVAFAVRFEATSNRLLGPYTESMDSYSNLQLGRRGEMGATSASLRRNVEHHLNVVGAELLDRAWRDTSQPQRVDNF